VKIRTACNRTPRAEQHRVEKHKKIEHCKTAEQRSTDQIKRTEHDKFPQNNKSRKEQNI
jgi:hypothetical protein